MVSAGKEKVAYRVKIFGAKLTVLKQPIRIKYLIKQKPRGELAEKQVVTEGSHRRG